MFRNHIPYLFSSNVYVTIRLKYEAIDNKGVALAFLRCAVYEEDERMLTDDVKEFKAWLGDYNPFRE